MGNTYIQAFGISGYRSFGSEPQLFPSLNKINLIIGQNNSGKSNVLRYLTEQYAQVVESCRRGSSYNGLKDLDRPLRNENRLHTFYIGVFLQGETYDEWWEGIKARVEGSGIPFRNVDKIFDKIIKFLSASYDQSIAWFRYEPMPNSTMVLAKSFIDETRKSSELTESEWSLVWRALTRAQGGNILNHWIPETLKTLSPVHREVPSIAFVPAIREVKPAQEDQNNFNGLGLIDELAKLQNPGYREQELKDRFEDINAFLQAVTGNTTARIEIPADRDTILAHIDGITLPLQALGTGIHEVVILASAATVFSEQVVCIEEPEIHLHPTLQKKLIRYLEENTSNQYFIASHSAHFLDVGQGSVYHIKLKDGCSQVKFISSTAEKSSMCFDLGYK